MVAVVDYGVGNLFSLRCSLNKIGVQSTVTGDVRILREADRLILPGVGAFGNAAEKLRASGLDVAIKELAAGGKPLLGICLGMQLLFDKSYEYGEHKGLGVISGKVCPLKNDVENLKIPHMGWNSLRLCGKSPLFKYIKDGDYVYFVHSYHVKCEASLLAAVTRYGIEVTAAVSENNVYGTQFHPEKSGEVGLKILQAFCETEGGKC